MPVHAGHGAGLEIPAGDADSVVVLELGGYSGDVAFEGHGRRMAEAVPNVMPAKAGSQIALRSRLA